MSTEQPPPRASREEILAALEDLRAKLLDLTGHNPLLNYRHGKRSTRFLRIVDELPSQVASSLLNGRAMKFGPVPRLDDFSLRLWQGDNEKDRDPTPAEWAKLHGIDTSFELPRTGAGGRHEDKVLQTLFYPAQLEGRLKAISRLARTSVEETGVNMLHLIVGFLEWHESEDSDVERLAPLITIPVTLEKKNLNLETSTYEYEISYSGEDCQHNASLANRMEQDFGYRLPLLPDEFDVEDYFAEVERSIQHNFPHWKLRRYMTLGFLNFGKLLMWRDLDPERWPEGRKLEENELIADIIAGTRGLDESGNDGMEAIFEEEISIDQIDNIYEDFPIIDNADSSQHSALIDAVCGKNLVIEGPPGTGKSQTITNLIAAALNAGKTVLFVSEKLAALEVVKQRLDRLGLGDYCLELHSHATKKAGVIESFKQRFERPRPMAPAAYDDQIRRHRQLSDLLAIYVDRINSEWKDTGRTIHQILVGATRMWSELPEELRDVLDTGVNTSEWDRTRLDDIIQEAKAFQALVANLVEELGGESIGEAHPWRGIAVSGIPMTEASLQLEQLEEWNEGLRKLSASWARLEEVLDFSPDTDNWAVIRRTSGEVDALPEPPENVLWKELPWTIQEGYEVLEDLVERWSAIEKAARSGEAPVEVSDLPDLDIMGGFRALQSLVAGGLAETASLESLLGSLSPTEKAVEHAKEIQGYFEEFHDAVAGEAPPQMRGAEVSLADLRSVNGLLSHLGRVGPRAAELRRRDWIDRDTIDGLRKFASVLEKLQGERGKQTEQFLLDSAPDASELELLAIRLSDAGMMRRLFSSDYRRARKTVVGFLQEGKKGFDWMQIISQLKGLQRHLNAAGEFVKEVEEAGRLPEDLWKQLDTDAGLFSRSVDWHEWILEKHATRTGGLFSAFEPDEFGAWCLECPATDLDRVHAFEKVDFGSKVAWIENAIEGLESLREDKEQPLVSEGDSLVDDRGVLELLFTRLQEGAPVERCSGIQAGWSLRAIGERLAELKSAAKQLQNWLGSVAEIPGGFGGESLTDEPEKMKGAAEVMEATGRWGSTFSKLDEMSVVRSIFLNSPKVDTVTWLRAWAKKLREALKSADQAADKFGSAVSWDLQAWSNGIETLPLQIERNTSAIASPEMLPGYLRFRTMHQRLAQFGIGRLAERIVSNGYTETEVEAACRHAVLRGLGNTILAESPMLRDFDSARHRQVQRVFQELDQQLIKLTRGKVAAKVATRTVPAGTRGTRVRDHTEGVLLRHEAGKQRSHLPIRQLLRRAGQAAQNLKPCFMMGPRSVAQYLEPGGLTFDLLVIDEASQMKPQDAIGAAARVNQVVIVGDPKQLPPTSFFDRLNTSDGDDEDQFSTGSSESILDATMSIFSARRLRWHYRSRHEALIAFSNRNFYDNHLLIFPATGADGFRMGIQFRPVEDGCFVSQVNQSEALAVAERVQLLLTAHPEMSLGVATMSAKQRDLVEGLIEDLAKKNPEFNRALAKNRERYECLFVKNLETVQGDERAVMLISCTYGPPEVGERVPQRFGPINSDVGWRRLNVLFTRARDRMEVFSSMRAGDIVPGPNSSRGVHAFRGFLHYAETKDFEVGTVSDRPPDSDFEIAVGRMLEQHGYKFDYQVGVAGFFIDLAVKHPQRPSEYIMGIECDGATYHTGKSVRDRDRLRQEVIEARGWKIRRIWSTDWFVNPRGAIAPILDELSRVAPTP